jgi:hypothetical protein
MPVMTGLELRAQLMARDPAQAGRIALMTGGPVATAQDENFLRSIPQPLAREAVRCPRDPGPGRPDARYGQPGRRATRRVGRILTAVGV